MKLFEDMEEMGGTINDVIQNMINTMFEVELDDDDITEIVKKLGLSDLLALDDAYSSGNIEQVQDILGPLPTMEYSMGGGASTSAASSRPAARTAAAPVAKKQTTATQSTSSYSGGGRNTTASNQPQPDPDVEEEPIEESDYSKRRKDHEDQISGKKKPKPAKKPTAKTDYMKRRAVKEDRKKKVDTSTPEWMENWVTTEFDGDHMAALDHASYMADVGRDPEWLPIINYLTNKTSSIEETDTPDNLIPYNSDEVIRALLASADADELESLEHLANRVYQSYPESVTVADIMHMLNEPQLRDVRKDDVEYALSAAGIVDAMVNEKSIEEATSMDGDEFAVGDAVGFKDGYEQSGRLTQINGNNLTISVYDSDSGERYNVNKSARQCWKESATPKANIVEMTAWLKRRAGIA
jgi:hypothetical protein